jgi:adenine phosphoribosyltransferase
VELLSSIQRIRDALRTIPDFPKPGIQFIDITPVLQDGQLFRLSINLLIERFHKKRLDAIVGVDARGFILGGAVACQLGIGFVPMRKKGKLPYKTKSLSYDLEYGSATLEVHEDAIKPGQRIALVDDLLATGGTSAAAAALIEQLGGEIIEMSFLVELAELGGAEKIKKYPVYSIVTIGERPA